MAYPHDLDPEGTRLPVRFDTTSNGEFVPVPLTAGQRAANALAHRAASENSRRLGIGRRAFLTSTMGAASVLAACNRAHAGAGGSFALAPDATLDPAAAAQTLAGNEFIFDVQLHCVDPTAPWRTGAEGEEWRMALGQAFPQAVKCSA